jgi:hypothetical protein
VIENMAQETKVITQFLNNLLINKALLFYQLPLEKLIQGSLGQD